LVAPRHSNETIAAFAVYGSSSKRSEQFAHVTGYAGGKLRETVERQAKLLRDFNQNALYFGKGLGTRRKWSQVEALALFNALGLAVDILSSLLLGLCGSLPRGLTGALLSSRALQIFNLLFPKPTALAQRGASDLSWAVGANGARSARWCLTKALAPTPVRPCPA
jgi:hypothetical protein